MQIETWCPLWPLTKSACNKTQWISGKTQLNLTSKVHTGCNLVVTNKAQWEHRSFRKTKNRAYFFLKQEMLLSHCLSDQIWQHFLYVSPWQGAQVQLHDFNLWYPGLPHQNPHKQLQSVWTHTDRLLLYDQIDLLI